MREDFVAEFLLIVALLFASEVAGEVSKPLVLDWLCSLKEANNEHAWPRNWCTDADVCTWHGVQCSRKPQQVFSVALRDVPLDAELSEQAYEPGVASLALHNCSVYGEIERPFRGVTSLYLPQNALRGAPPPRFFDALVAIDLSRNELSSCGDMCTRSTATKIDLSHNRMSDDLSACSAPHASFGSTLLSLALNDNEFRGTAPFPSALMAYNIARNRFTDVADARPFKRVRAPVAGVNSGQGRPSAPPSALVPALTHCDLSNNAFGEAGTPVWLRVLSERSGPDAFVARLCKVA